MAKSRVLVTGGAGFIGSHLVKLLVNLGYEVIVYDDYSTGSEFNEIEGATYHKSDAAAIRFCNLKFKYIFHLAAFSRVQPSFDNPTACFENNVYLTSTICEYVRKYGGKLIYAGSSSKHQTDISPYSKSKELGEEIVKLYRDVYKVDAEIARFYNVYGPGEITEGSMAAVIGKFRNAIKEDKPLTIVGDGEQRRDFTHVDDIVNGLYLIAEGVSSHEDAWELGTGLSYSINEVADMFDHRVTYVDDKPGNYRSSLKINNDAYERLGWKANKRLKDYIQSL